MATTLKRTKILQREVLKKGKRSGEDGGPGHEKTRSGERQSVRPRAATCNSVQETRRGAERVAKGDPANYSVTEDTVRGDCSQTDVVEREIMQIGCLKRRQRRPKRRYIGNGNECSSASVMAYVR